MKLFWLKKLIIDKSGQTLVCGLQVPGKELLTTQGCGLAIATTTESSLAIKS